MTTFSTPSHYVHLLHDAPLCLLFHAVALCLPFPFCSCAMSPFSTQLRYVYVFHAAPLRLLSCADPGIFVEGGGGGGGGGGSTSIQQKSFDNVFFSLVLSLFYRSQMVNFKENYDFSRIRRGSNLFQVGAHLFQGGGPIAYSL